MRGKSTREGHRGETDMNETGRGTRWDRGT